MKSINIKNYWLKLPDFSFSHILLRLPLAIVFIEQGLSKLPFNSAVGGAFGLSPLVWWVVCYGEIAAGVGLLLGAITTMPRIKNISYVSEMGDLITRFSGITMCCIITGVIWVVIKPESLLEFVLHDNLHLFLWVGGLYFALRGNWAVAAEKTLKFH